MKKKQKVLFFTLYDNICIGSRILSSIAQEQGLESHLVIFKDQRTRARISDSKDHLSYQFYFDGIKYGSCYAAYKYTETEINLFIDLVKNIAPDIMCLSTRSFGYSASKEIVQKLRELKDTPVIAGGWGPSLEKENFLEFCDYVCFGEGEKVMYDICRKILKSDYDFSDVKNLCYRKNGVIISNPLNTPLTNEELTAVPFADFSQNNKYLIDGNKMKYGFESFNVKIYNCLAGRGCPLNCTYCMSSKYAAIYKDYGFEVKRYRIRDVDRVIDELIKAKEEGATYIRISDEIFPIWPDWIQRFMWRYRREVDLPFFAYVRPEFHSPKVIKGLIEIGMTSSIVGIQAGSDRIRKKIFKRVLPEHKLVEFAKLLKANEIEYTYHLINFNPFETEDDMRKTLELLNRLPYAPLVLFKLVPFSGTPIKRMIDERDPQMLPENTQKWYGFLYAMAVKSRNFRSLGKIIYNQGLLTNNISMMAIMFMPGFIQLHVKRLLRRIKYGSATLLPIPTRDRKKVVGNAESSAL